MQLLRRSRELTDPERREADRREGKVGERGEVATTEAGRFLADAEGGEGEDGKTGTEGSVAEGAGLGEGMLRMDSFDVRRRVGTAGVGVRLRKRSGGVRASKDRERTQGHRWRCMSSWWTWIG